MQYCTIYNDREVVGILSCHVHRHGIRKERPHDPIKPMALGYGYGAGETVSSKGKLICSCPCIFQIAKDNGKWGRRKRNDNDILTVNPQDTASKDNVGI